MKVLTMKKSGAKTIFAFCIALTLFMSHSTLAFAAICDNAPGPDKVHHFDICVREGTGFVRDGGTHTYLYGYDAQHNPIYRSDCRLVYRYENCNHHCRYCGLKQDGDRHYHLESTTHSIDHI